VRPSAQPLIFAAALGPLAYLAARAWQRSLGANAIETNHALDGALDARFMLITLARTPARRLTGWNDIVRVRRMLGLFAFLLRLTAPPHLRVAGSVFDLAAIVKDRPRSARSYTAGFSAYALLVPLAITSTAGMIRRLGAARAAAATASPT